MRVKIFVVVVLALFGVAQSALADGSLLRGVVRDSTTQLPIRAATVRIEGTSQGAITNARGEYSIRNVSRGTATIRVTFIG